MKDARRFAFAITLTVLTACGRTYDQIPDAFNGNWTSDKLTNVVAAKIDARKIILVDEDGKAETCAVDYVSVHYPIFGKGKRTTVVCQTTTPSASRKARIACGSSNAKLYRWTIQLDQEDPEGLVFLDLLENIDTNCDEKDSDMPLGMFSKS